MPLHWSDVINKQKVSLIQICEEQKLDQNLPTNPLELLMRKEKKMMLSYGFRIQLLGGFAREKFHYCAHRFISAQKTNNTFCNYIFAFIICLSEPNYVNIKMRRKDFLRL